MKTTASFEIRNINRFSLSNKLIMALRLALLVGLFVVASTLQVPFLLKSSNYIEAHTSTVKILPEFEYIAPLPVGDFGSDILQHYGGIFRLISSLQHQKQRFVSELADGGYVQWLKTNSSTSVEGSWTKSSVVVDVGGLTNFKLLGDFFGLGGTAWRGWAVGRIYAARSGRYLVAVQGVRYWYLDSERQVFMGDPYRASITPYALDLSAGEHDIIIPIGSLSQKASFEVHIKPFKSDPITLLESETLIPDAVDGILASRHIGITLMNHVDRVIGPITVHVQIPETHIATSLTLDSVEPGRPCPVSIAFSEDDVLELEPNLDHLTILIEFENTRRLMRASVRKRRFGQPFKFSFIDFDGSVQKAAAYPPVEECGARGCPILFTTHGAGVEADSDAWTGSYQRQRHAWILFPTNRRNYGYDWEGPGYTNGMFALGHLVAEIPGVPKDLKSRYQPDSTRRLYAGHSMGGHGCLVFSITQPDCALASVCASGWIRRDYYISSAHYSTGTSRLDHQRVAIFQSALEEFSPDLHLSNMAGIPSLMRMGTADDTVPAWELRRIARMLNEINRNASWTQISEVKGGGHWWGGIVDDGPIQQFFDAYLKLDAETQVPDFFELTVVNPATNHGRAGLRVLQTLVPYKIAKVKVKRESGTWSIETKNVKRFQLGRSSKVDKPEEIQVDDYEVSLLGLQMNDRVEVCLVEDVWELCADADWKLRERSPGTYGPLRQVISQRPLLLVYPNSSAIESEVNYLIQQMYYQGRIRIETRPSSTFKAEDAHRYNLIIIGTPCNNEAARYIHRQRYENQLVWYDEDCRRFGIGKTAYGQPDHAVIYLSPFVVPGASEPNTAIVVNGLSDDAFVTAFRNFMPVHSSITMADFAVIDASRLKRNGMSGILAFGFWSNEWTWDDRHVGWVDRP